MHLFAEILSAAQAEDMQAYAEQVQAAAPWSLLGILVLLVVGVLLAFPGVRAKLFAWLPDFESLAAKTSKTPASQALHDLIAADMPALKAAEENLLALGRDPAEVVTLFESQIAKRIAAAKGVGK